jgi:hypothetical protein
MLKGFFSSSYAAGALILPYLQQGSTGKSRILAHNKFFAL